MANAEAGTPFCLVHGCPLEAEDSGGRQTGPPVWTHSPSLLPGLTLEPSYSSLL